MKFLVIGRGFIAPRHESAIKEIGGEIAGVVSKRDGEDAWKEAIDKTDAEYVSVLTPNDLHYEMCKYALEKGKKVICEKPLTIDSRHAEELSKYDNIFSVLQLRYHPLVEGIKSNLKDHNEVEMDIHVYRDPEYFEIWKGQTERSGGVLFNLGVHYFDMMQYLFGDVNSIENVEITDKYGKGVLKGDKFTCNFRVGVDAERDNQKRVFRINGVDYNFSSQDNLSYEDLHKYTYRDLIEGKGITPDEANKTIKLIERIKNEVL